MSAKTKKSLVIMVAILIVLIILIIILAVTDKKELTDEQLGETIIAEAVEAAANGETTTDTIKEEKETEPVIVDLPNEKEVSLYVDGGGVMNRVTEFNSTWSTDYDIAIFEAINSKEDQVYYDNYFALHEEYWNAVASTVEYKIGYELSFDVNGEHKVYTILSPADIENNADLFMGDAVNDVVTGYMGVWVYYDMYQTGTYIHLTSADMADGVLMTSIKLRPTPLSSEISNFTLTAFSYSSNDEISSEGHYIGTHGYKIAINNQ